MRFRQRVAVEKAFGQLGERIGTKLRGSEHQPAPSDDAGDHTRRLNRWNDSGTQQGRLAAAAGAEYDDKGTARLCPASQDFDEFLLGFLASEIDRGMFRTENR